MGGGKWKIGVQTRQCLFKVRELGPGEIFGHDELLAHFDRVCELVKSGKRAADVRIPKRYYRVVAEEQTDLFFLDIAKFYMYFTDSELKSMRKHVAPIDHTDIHERVAAYYDNKRANLECVLDALRVNLQSYAEPKDQGRHLDRNERMIAKLEGWLKQLKSRRVSAEDLKLAKTRIK